MEKFGLPTHYVVWIGDPDYVRPPFPLIVEKIPSEMEVALLHKEHLGTWII